MTKEMLTVGAIKRELKKERKQRYAFLWGCLFFLLVLALLTAWMGKLGGLWIILAIFFGGWTLLFLMAFVALIKEILELQNGLKYRICVVKDTLIGMEEKDDTGRNNRIRKIYHLYFSGYGEYVTFDREEHYAWSTVLGSMSGKGVYLASHCGDEFYLVLSKPHTGKILHVYNTNLFDFEEK